ncbi:glycosyltransferase family 4 protein [Microlunatus ginsengisoli]|uniref:Glycosyltransferase family 4 protein n=1 Tax=Microlunatus ginsengisoli TaxID=363863 RepID=A0ABP6ZHC1_9ACTN
MHDCPGPGRPPALEPEGWTIVTADGPRTGSGAPTLLIAHPSADVYGADLQLLESVSAMTERGWRVVVAVPGDGPLVARLQDRGAEVGFVGFPVLRRANTSARGFATMIGQTVLALPRLVRVIRSFAPAAVYVNTVTLPWWLLASRLVGRPTICHLHEAETGDNRLVLKGLLAPLRLAHAVIVISRSTLDAMAEIVPALRERARLIYNGVPQPPEEPAPAPRGEPLRAVVVGRLSPRKAPHLALEAVGALRAKGYRIELEIVGTAFEGYEWYVEELEQRATRPDLDGAVTFLGYASPIWPVLAGADLAVAPSLREPFGNAVVEAQLARRPVVATAALGHTESIADGETGLLVPAEDVSAMADAIARLADDGELAGRLAEAGRRSAVDRFSIERYRAEVAELVGSLTA